MGKKSKRRPAKTDEKKEERRREKGAPSPSPAGGGAVDPRLKLELLNQSQLIAAGRRYYGDGYEWTRHDDALLGDTEYGPYDAAYAREDEDEGTKSRDDEQLSAAKGYEEGSEVALRAALDELWSDESLSNPHGVGLAMGPKKDWVDWSLDNATRKPDRVEMFAGAYQSDVGAHRSTLDRLSADRDNNLDFILASNCILHDTLDRLGMDPPPPLNLHQALSIRLQEGGVRSINRMRMEVWKAYKKLALEMVKAVARHPIMPPPEPPSYHHEVYPFRDIGEFPPSLSRLKDGGDDGGSAFGGACGFSGAEVEELMAQGVKPWDDDAHAVLAALNGDYDY